MWKTKDVCKYLKVSQLTLRRWEKKGMFTPQRLDNGQKRYTKEQIDEFLEKAK